MLASALQTFVAVIDGAYVLGQEGQPLEVTEKQATELLRDGMIVLAEVQQETPKPQPKSKRASDGGVL